MSLFRYPGYPPAVATPGQDRKPLQGLCLCGLVALGLREICWGLEPMVSGAGAGESRVSIPGRRFCGAGGRFLLAGNAARLGWNLALPVVCLLDVGFGGLGQLQ
jgi:hypothetical protein